MNLVQKFRLQNSDPSSHTRGVELSGSAEAILKAAQMIKDVLSKAESGGSGAVGRGMGGQPGGTEQFSMQIPSRKVGLVIGKGGETIKNMQASSGARIQVIPLHPPPGDTSTERTGQIDGTSKQVGLMAVVMSLLHILLMQLQVLQHLNLRLLNLFPKLHLSRIENSPILISFSNSQFLHQY